MRNCVLLVAVALSLGTVGCGNPESDPVQPRAATDIFLVDMRVTDGGIVTGAPHNLTDRPAYDNQPRFLPDGAGFLYAAEMDDQVDCFRYDLSTGQRKRLTATDEREYSPAPIPGRTGFSSVRVEEDGSRRLWEFDEPGEESFLLIEWEYDVDYYAWIDDSLVALRIDRDEPQLRFADADVGWVEEEPVALDVGRCLRLTPDGGALSYVHRLKEDEAWIVELDLLTRREQQLVRALPGSEDFAWTTSGALVMARGSRLFSYRPGLDRDWQEIADYSSYGLLDITRVEVAPDDSQMLFVVPRAAAGSAAVDAGSGR